MKNRLRVLLVILLLLASVLFCIGAFKRAFRPHGNDFTSYLNASKALLNGENPYDTGAHFPYLYPPLLAFLLIPLLFVPYWFAVLFWFLANAAALCFCAWLMTKLLKNQTAGFSRIGVILLLFAAPIQSNLLNGQVNAVVLLLCLSFLYFYAGSRNFAASFFLAFAIVLKVMPFVLLGFLVFRKRFKELIYTILFIFLLALLPAVIVRGSIFDLYDSFVQTMTRYANQPVSFAEGKKFFSLEAFLAYAGLDVDWSKWFSRLFLLAAVVALEIFRIIKRVQDRSFVWFSFYLTIALLISPFSEIHHFVLCIPAAVLSVAPGLQSRKLEWTCVALFWIFYFTAHLFEEGPFYFLSLVSLLTALSLRNFERAKAPSIIIAQESKET